MGYLQRWVYETNNIRIESSIDWEQNGQFSEGLHCAQKHRTNDEVAYDLYITISLRGRRKCILKQSSNIPNLPGHQWTKHFRMQQTNLLQ